MTDRKQIEKDQQVADRLIQISIVALFIGPAIAVVALIVALLPM